MSDDCVPIAKLEKLRDKWRNGEGKAYTTAQFICSDELNELIKEYEDD